MNAYAARLRKQARERLRRLTGQEPAPDGDPILELIAVVLADEGGGAREESNPPVSTARWVTWNRWALESPETLSETIAQLMEREEIEIPESPEAMRFWAAQVLLGTLDRRGLL